MKHVHVDTKKWKNVRPICNCKINKFKKYMYEGSEQSIRFSSPVTASRNAKDMDSILHYIAQPAKDVISSNKAFLISIMLT